jgi:alpha-glucosidase
MFRQIRRFHACLLFLSLNAFSLASASPNLDSCPGYDAVNVQVTETGLTADLILAGEPCGVYGPEIERLSLLVQTQTG